MCIGCIELCVSFIACTGSTIYLCFLLNYTVSNMWLNYCYLLKGYIIGFLTLNQEADSIIDYLVNLTVGFSDFTWLDHPSWDINQVLFNNPNGFLH